MYEGNVIPIDGYKQGRMENLSDTRHIYNMNEIKEGEKVDDLLKTYIEKVDRDQVSLREDIRESERRTEKRIHDYEERMENRFDRIEKLIRDQNEDIKNLKDEVNNRLQEDQKYRHTNNIAIIIGVIATVLSMVGIYYATVSSITDIIGLMK